MDERTRILVGTARETHPWVKVAARCLYNLTNSQHENIRRQGTASSDLIEDPRPTILCKAPRDLFRNVKCPDAAISGGRGGDSDDNKTDKQCSSMHRTENDILNVESIHNYAEGDIVESLGLVCERLLFQAESGCHESFRNFKLFAGRLHEWRKRTSVAAKHPAMNVRLPFLEPKIAMARNRILKLGRLPNDITAIELICFSCLASSRLWHEHLCTSQRSNIILREWFDGLHKTLLEPNTACGTWARRLCQNKELYDPLKPPAALLCVDADHTRDAEFRQEYIGALDIELKPLSDAERDSINQFLPVWMCSEEHKPTNLQRGFLAHPRFMAERTISVPMVSEHGDLARSISPVFFEPGISCADFSQPLSLIRLKSELAYKKPLERHPLFYLLYEAIAFRKSRTALTALKVIEEIHQEPATCPTWRDMAVRVLMPLATDLGPTSVAVNTVEQLWEKYGWSAALLDQPACLDNVDQFRATKGGHNVIALLHAAASACRKSSVYKSLAGVRDAENGGAEDEDCAAKISKNSRGDNCGLSPPLIEPLSGVLSEEQACAVETITTDASDNEQCWGVRLMSALVTTLGASVHVADHEGMTPFFYAAVSGCVKCCEWILEMGGTMYGYDVLKRSPWYCAACVGEIGVLNFMKSRGFDYLSDANTLLRTPLCKATWAGFDETVEFLLKIGCDPCPVDSKGRTPLHTSVWGPNGGRSGTKVVGNHAADESYTCAKLLLKAGQDDPPEARRRKGIAALKMYDVDGSAPIHIAASTNATRCIGLLKQFGADLDDRSRTSLEWTPLMCAAYRGHLAAVREFVRLGASLQCKDIDGRDCFEYAIAGGHPDILNFLLTSLHRNGKRMLARRFFSLCCIAAMWSQSQCLSLLFARMKSHFGSSWNNKSRWKAMKRRLRVYGRSSEEDITVNLLDLVVLGQRVLPVSGKFFRSAPFPPFRIYDWSKADAKDHHAMNYAPSQALRESRICSLAAFDSGSDCVWWKSHNWVPENVVASTAKTLSTVPITISPPMAVTLAMIMRAFYECIEPWEWLRLLCAFFAAGEHDQIRKDYQYSSMNMSRPELASSPALIRGKLGLKWTRVNIDRLSCADNLTPPQWYMHKFWLENRLFPNELQKLARNVFLLTIDRTFLIIECLRALNEAPFTSAPGKQVAGVIVENLLRLRSAGRKAPIRARGDVLSLVDECIVVWTQSGNMRVGTHEPQPLLEASLGCRTHKSSNLLFPGNLLATCTPDELEIYLRLTPPSLSTLTYRCYEEGDIEDMCTLPKGVKGPLAPIHLAVLRRDASLLNQLLERSVNPDGDAAAALMELASFAEACGHFSSVGLIHSFLSGGSLMAPSYRYYTASWTWLMGSNGSFCKKWVSLKRSSESAKKLRDQALAAFCALTVFENGLENDPASKSVSGANAVYAQTVEVMNKLLTRLNDLREASQSPVAVGVDLEFHVNLHSNAPDIDGTQYTLPDCNITCLLQLAWHGPHETEVAILDCQALWEEIRDCETLRKVLADPEVVKVFHGSHMDLRRLIEDFDFEVNTIWDTYRGAEILSRGLSDSGAKEGQCRKSVREALHVNSLKSLAEYYMPTLKLDKSFQRRDWRVRPLTPEMLAYAGLDASILLRLLHFQLEDFRRLGGGDWKESMADGSVRSFSTALASSLKCVDSHFPCSSQRNLCLTESATPLRH